MKMSEFTTKSFLGNAGAAENSYILINYEDNTTQRPVTYKASLQEIGKAIANDQKLYKQTSNGPATTDVSQGAYVNSAEPLVKFNSHYNSLVTGNQTILPKVVMVESEHNTVGYYDSTSSESWTHVNTFEPGETVELPIGNSQNAQEGKPVLHGGMGLFFDGSDSGRAAVVPIVTYDSTEGKLGYYDSLDGEMQYVDAGGGAAGFTTYGDIPVYVGASDGELKWYNWADPSDCTPYAVTKTNGSPLVVYDSTTGEIGYYTDVSSSITAIDGLASTGYVTSAIRDKVIVNDSGQLYYYNSEGSLDAVTIDMIEGGATPSTMDYGNGTTLSYLLVNGSTDTYYKDEYGTWCNVGCPPVFYNTYTERFVDIAGEPITIATGQPYTMDISNWTFNYMAFDSDTGKSYITDNGDYYYQNDLGHPLFFNDNENEIGYYKYENGERVWQAVNSLT